MKIKDWFNLIMFFICFFGTAFIMAHLAIAKGNIVEAFIVVIGFFSMLHFAYELTGDNVGHKL